MDDKKNLVAFIDILGFKNLIDAHFSGRDKFSLILLQKAMNEAKQYAIDYSKKYLKQFEIKFSFRQFSDCISISMPFKQKESYSMLTIYGAFINVVRAYQAILLGNNILVRGGISVGGHFEDSNIIFSEALVKAYKLENQSAIYPRILIDREILHSIQSALINASGEDVDIFYQLYGASVITDWDDEVFISPFGMVGELKAFGNIFGEDVLKNMVESLAEANELELDSPSSLLDDLDDADEYAVKVILNYASQFLVENKAEKPEVLAKYKWLIQFAIWTLTPQHSHIRFKRYFSNGSSSVDSSEK